MKTAMQEWFDELKANYPYMANEIYQKGFEKYLKKEKEQHKETWFRSTAQFDNSAEITYKKLFEEHYNETYNQNK